MPLPKHPRFDTISLHGGQRPDPATGARAVPIYQTTSFVFEDTDQPAELAYRIGFNPLEAAVKAGNRRG